MVGCLLLRFLAVPAPLFSSFFFFNDTATTEIYTLSLHDALPIWWWSSRRGRIGSSPTSSARTSGGDGSRRPAHRRSEEHTSELQSLAYLVCRLLLEKKKKPSPTDATTTGPAPPRCSRPPADIAPP